GEALHGRIERGRPVGVAESAAQVVGGEEERDRARRPHARQQKRLERNDAERLLPQMEDVRPRSADCGTQPGSEEGAVLVARPSHAAPPEFVASTLVRIGAHLTVVLHPPLRRQHRQLDAGLGGERIEFFAEERDPRGVVDGQDAEGRVRTHVPARRSTPRCSAARTPSDAQNGIATFSRSMYVRKSPCTAYVPSPPSTASVITLIRG